MSLSPKKSEPHIALPITHLKGVGTKLAAHLARLDIYTVADLLFHLPTRYQDRTRIYPIAQLAPGMYAMIEVEVVKQQIMFGKRRRLEVQLADSSGYIYMSLFHFSTAQRKQLQTGLRIRCFGEVSFFGNRLQMVHPEYEVAALSTPPSETLTLTPIYPSTDGLTQKTWRNLITQALSLTSLHLADYLPALNEAYTLRDALLYCHQPPHDAALALLEAGTHPAQARLAVEELLAHHLSLRLSRAEIKKLAAPTLQCTPNLLATFYQQLPFSPTAAQLRCLAEIFADLSQSHPMLRLLQGDVGSGKTLVAAGSILAAVSLGYQAALMVPTEILSEQHVLTLKKYFSALNISVIGLNSRMPAPQKKLAYEQINNGVAQVVVGTHALIQEAVAFHRLGLIIIDEQHRFGVAQRLELQAKSGLGGLYAHQLIMTATPIPRTLAMTAYADLDYSVIDELPPQRKPITTIALPNARRPEIIEKVRHFCALDQQVYWICTLIEESEVLTAQAASITYETLKAALPEYKIALIHGQLKTAEKQTIMQAFKNKDIHLLVATTVIEVGVDVPNANLMIIENAERLGLAQLHQLRGRVGRGVHESHCMLMYQTPLSFHAKARLDIMRKTTDGFKIAEQDLKLRGSGELLGTRQSGDLNFRVAQLGRDQHLMDTVAKLADVMQAQHAELIPALIARWLGSKLRYGGV